MGAARPSGSASGLASFYNRATGTRTETATAPDGSYVIQLYTNGRLTSTTPYAYGGTQLGQTTYAYDASGRMATATDARNGTTSYTYDDADRVLSVTTPPPGTDQAPQTTTSYYDNLGRVWKIVNPDGTSVINQFYTSGLLYRAGSEGVH
jgi:YD repeat-containing protein